MLHRSLLQIFGLPMVTVESAGQIAAALYTFDERFIRKGRESVPPVLGVPEG